MIIKIIMYHAIALIIIDIIIIGVMS